MTAGVKMKHFSEILQRKSIRFPQYLLYIHDSVIKNVGKCVLITFV